MDMICVYQRKAKKKEKDTVYLYTMSFALFFDTQTHTVHMHFFQRDELSPVVTKSNPSRDGEDDTLDGRWGAGVVVWKSSFRAVICA